MTYETVLAIVPDGPGNVIRRGMLISFSLQFSLIWPSRVQAASERVAFLLCSGEDLINKFFARGVAIYYGASERSGWEALIKSHKSREIRMKMQLVY